MTVQSRTATSLSLLPLSFIALTSAWAQRGPLLAPTAAPGSLVAANDERPLYDPAQLPSFVGRVQQFTLTPRGEIDGFVLSDGTEVKTPPHLSTSMAYAIKPGDTVTIHGLRAAAIPLIQAVSLTDRTSGQTILDTDTTPPPAGPPRGGPPPPNGRPGDTRLAEAQGPIRMSLHGPRGEVNGVLLANGTVLRLPPDAADNYTSLLQPGKPIVARGVQVSNAIGRVLEVREIGASREQLTSIAPAPPPGPGFRGGPPQPLPAPDAPPPPPVPLPDAPPPPPPGR
jgi:hypothetical protein